MTSFLVVYGTGHGHTEKIARYVGSSLSKRGHDVTTLRASGASTVDVESVDAVLVGSPVYAKRHLPEVLEFIQENRGALRDRPSAFFQVSIALVWAERWARESPSALAERIAAKTGWRPDRVGFFRGAVTYTQYGRPTRWLFGLVSTLTTGDADTSRDYEYTDWDEVERFAVEFGEYVDARRERGSTARFGHRELAALGLVGAVLAMVIYRSFAGRRTDATDGPTSPDPEDSGRPVEP